MHKRSLFSEPLFIRVSNQDVLFFTKHLATMIKAGIPLSEALSVLIAETQSPSLKRIVGEVLEDVSNGQAFSKALQRHPRVFDNLYCQLIKASEKSGKLEENLDFLAIQLGKSFALKKKIQAALLYPGLVLGATTIMAGFISLVVLPQLVDFFKTFDTELPFATKLLLGFANLMKNYGTQIFIGLVFLFILLSVVVRTKHVKPIWHRFLLSIPLFGRLFQYIQLARLSRNLGVLLASGVPIVPSLETTAHTIDNVVFRQHLELLLVALSEGKKLGVTLAERKYSEFPQLVASMVSIGEKTGKLDETLLYLADFYEEEIDLFSKNLSTLLEPILLLVIGLAVGFVAVAIISPIYQLTSSLRN